MNMQEMNDKLNAWFNEFIEYLKLMPNDEKYSWSAIILGSILVIAGLILWFL